MKTVCIVQARMGSTRLPGKVLLPLNGHTVIGEVLTRCKKIPGVDEVVCAIPDTAENDKLELVAQRYCAVYSGDEHDVLGRYYEAAQAHRADIIVRVTGDCPLISPGLCGETVRGLKERDADYCSNLEPRMFPRGYDCEAFTMDILARADEEAQAHEREHVTTWMLANEIYRIGMTAPWVMEGRLTLDTEDDYKVLCMAFGHKPYEQKIAA